MSTCGLSDGFLFRDIDVAELSHAHMAYAGVEVSMIAHFGRTRFPVAIDVGFGDTAAIPAGTLKVEVLTNEKEVSGAF